MMPSTVGLICARGGSKGVFRKNLRLLGDKPLIGWAIEVARQCPSLNRVIVSTEDSEIASVARQYGAQVPFVRPLELAQDNSPELLVWKHALETLRALEGQIPKTLVSIPATSPFRAVEDIESCIETLTTTSADLCLTVKQAHSSPYFNMVEITDGWARLAVNPTTPVFRRQDAPKVFEITTVAYAARSTYVLQTDRLLNGKVQTVTVPEERSLDIDTELDFEFAEFLLKRRAEARVV